MHCAATAQQQQQQLGNWELLHTPMEHAPVHVPRQPQNLTPDRVAELLDDDEVLRVVGMLRNTAPLVTDSSRLRDIQQLLINNNTACDPTAEDLTASSALDSDENFEQFQHARNFLL